MTQEKPQECPLTSAAEILGRKWTLVIVGHLMQEEKRFTELKNEIPQISQKVLSTNLKNLQEHGIIKKEIQIASPVKTSYRLTEKGKDLEDLVNEIKEWEDKWN